MVSYVRQIQASGSSTSVDLCAHVPGLLVSLPLISQAAGAATGGVDAVVSDAAPGAVAEVRAL